MARADTLWGRLKRAAPLIIIIALITLAMERAKLFDAFETTGIDASLLMQRPRAMEHVSVVALTEKEYESEYAGKRAFAYSDLAPVIDAVAAGGASVIGVDIETSAPSFRKLRLKPTKARIIWVVDATHSGKNYMASSPLGGAKWHPAAIAGLGVIHADPDGVIRRYSRDLPMRNGMHRTFSWSVVKEYCHVRPAEAQCSRVNSQHDDTRERLIDFTGLRRVPDPIPFHAAKALAEASPLPGTSDQGLAGRIVLIGATSSSCDVHRTPFGPMAGVYVLAETIESDLKSGGVEFFPDFLAFVLDIVIGGLIVVIHFYLRFRSAVLVSVLAIPVLSLFSSFVAFASFGRWFNFVPMIVAVLIHEVYEYDREYRNLQQAYEKLKASQATQN